MSFSKHLNKLILNLFISYHYFQSMSSIYYNFDYQKYKIFWNMTFKMIIDLSDNCRGRSPLRPAANGTVQVLRNAQCASPTTIKFRCFCVGATVLGRP